MKKIFTLAAAMIAALSVNAQEVCQIDAESAGITSTAADIAAGTVVGSSENLTISVLNKDEVKAASCKMKNSGFLIGGAALKADGITGSTNPTDESGKNPAIGDGTGSVGGVPVAGFAVKIDVKKDGYCYVAGKLSSNKNYYVFEAGLAIGFDLAMYCDDAKEMQPLNITVENDAEADGVPYRTAAIDWPEKLFLGDSWSTIVYNYSTKGDKIGKNGEGVIKFPVYADAGEYVVGAGGSKISVCGAVFSENGNLQVALPATDVKDSDGNVTSTEPEHILIEGEVTGISSVVADKAIDSDAPAYNIAGQRVSKDAKGLVIVGGKKYMNK